MTKRTSQVPRRDRHCLLRGSLPPAHLSIGVYDFSTVDTLLLSESECSHSGGLNAILTCASLAKAWDCTRLGRGDNLGNPTRVRRLSFWIFFGACDNSSGPGYQKARTVLSLN